MTTVVQLNFNKDKHFNVNLNIIVFIEIYIITTKKNKE